MWLPAPSIDAAWQRTYGNTWSGNATRSELVHDKKYGAAMLYAECNESVKDPVIEMTSSFATRDRAIDLSKPGKVEALSPADRAFYTAPTELLPTDGIVRAKAREATRGAKTDLDKARALYDWIVDNTFRDPKTRGCGVGDIKSMLETGNLGGKCADLNALYVGMARSLGLPARDVYGLRVVKSQFGYRSLGAGTDKVTRAQHRPAEARRGFRAIAPDFTDTPAAIGGEAAAGTPLRQRADLRRGTLARPPGTVHARRVGAMRGLAGEKQCVADRNGEPVAIRTRATQTQEGIGTARKRIGRPARYAHLHRVRNTATSRHGAATARAYALHHIGDDRIVSHGLELPRRAAGGKAHQRRRAVVAREVQPRIAKRRRVGVIGQEIKLGIPEGLRKAQADLVEQPHAQTPQRGGKRRGQGRRELHVAIAQHAHRQGHDGAITRPLAAGGGDAHGAGLPVYRTDFLAITNVDATRHHGHKAVHAGDKIAVIRRQHITIIAGAGGVEQRAGADLVQRRGQGRFKNPALQGHHATVDGTSATLGVAYRLVKHIGGRKVAAGQQGAPTQAHPHPG